MGTFLDASELGLKLMSDADFYPLTERVTNEFEHRSFMRGCKAEVDTRIDTYERYASTEEKDLKALADGAMIGPGERLKVGDRVYKNVARAWLDPFKAGPANFIAGWEEQQGGVL